MYTSENHLCLHHNIIIYTHMKVNMDVNPTVWIKQKNRVIQIGEFIVMKRFGFNNLHQDFDIRRIVHTTMDACRENRCKYYYIYTCESKYGCKSDSMNKAEKQNYPNRWIYCDEKPTLNISVSITFIRTLISGELFTQRWMLVEIMGAHKMYTMERYKRAHSVLNLKVLSMCLAHRMIFENIGFTSQ